MKHLFFFGWLILVALLSFITLSEIFLFFSYSYVLSEIAAFKHIIKWATVVTFIALVISMRKDAADNSKLKFILLGFGILTVTFLLPDILLHLAERVLYIN